MSAVPRNASSGSFEMVEPASYSSKSNSNEDFVVECLSSTPRLDYYFNAFGSINNLIAGKRPAGLSRLAVYNSFLGHLVRGEVSSLYIRLAPNSMLKACFKLKYYEDVYIVPLLDEENDSLWCQPRFYRGFHFCGFKGANIAHRFYLDHLIITVEDNNVSFPAIAGEQLLQMNYKKATVYGMLDKFYLKKIEEKCSEVTLLPEIKQSPLISGNFQYLDFTAVVTL